MVIGTAGHIDHGKTALVQALTGSNTDRLPEEQRRGISIDLGYAQLDLGDGRSASMVDVPGHERFVKNMVAGATGVDVFLLVVAADDGVMPQTREHLRILDILQVEQGVCALTKRDLVDADVAGLARLECEELLDGRGIPVLDVSARTGLGIEALRAALARLGGGSRPRARGGPARLWIDRSFSLRGSGTVATGTLWSGAIEPRQTLEALPQGERVRVRSVQIHGAATELAEAGNRVAVGLPGVAPADVPRGTLLCTPGSLAASYRLDVELLGLEGDPGSSPVIVHHGTGEQAARLISRGDVGQLRLTQPVAAMRGDRIVLRWNGRTLGGAVVVDPHPPRRVDDERIHAFAGAGPEEMVLALLDAAVIPQSVEDLERRGMLARAQIEQALAGTVDLGGVYVSPGRFEALREDLLQRLAQRAEDFPLDPGLALDDLGPLGDGRDRFIELLGVERRGNRVYGRGVQAQTRGYEAVIETLLAELAAAGITPVALRAPSGLPDAEFRALARELERRGLAVFVREDVALSPAAYERVRSTLIDACRAEGELSFATYKEALGVSRRTADLLLAHFDSVGLTRRRGEGRVLRGASRAR